VLQPLAIRPRRRAALACLLCSLRAISPLAAAPPSATPGFTVETLAPGVHALVRTKAPGFFLDANVVFIVNQEDVVVIDTNLTPTSAQASIAALRAITDKPVRTIVNTHRHADHTTGNAVYRDAFPEAEFVAHEAMREDLARHGEETLRGWTEWAAEMAREIPKALAAGTTLGGTTLGDEERASHLADLEAARAIVADTGRMRVLLPSLTVGDAGLVLHRGERTIEIRALGKGHTRGDLVVWLPREEVLVAGDILTEPVPLIGADQSYPEEWVATLDRILSLKPKIIVPGHGSLIRDGGPVRLYRDFLASAVEQTRAAMARGESAEQAIKAVDLASFRDRMAQTSPVLKMLFANWGKVPAVMALYRVREEASGSAAVLEDLIDKHTTARGGRRAIESIRSLEAKLRIEEPTTTADGLWRVDRAGRMRIDVFVDGRRVFTEAFDGERAWQQPGGAERGAPASVAGTAALRHSGQLPTNILGLHEMTSHGHHLELAPREEVAGVSYHVIVLTLDDGFQTRYYLDPATLMIVRARVRKALHPDIDPAVTTIETVWSDFRQIAGVRFPFRATETDLTTGELLQTTTLLDLRSPSGAAADLFQMP